MRNPKAEERVLISLKPGLHPPVSLAPKRLAAGVRAQISYLESENAWYAFNSCQGATIAYAIASVCALAH
jgi:hypothetical protein